MSVSLSSVYQQTQSLKEIDQKFEQALSNTQKFDTSISQLIQLSTNLTMYTCHRIRSQSYRLFVVMSKHLNNSSSIYRKYAALYTIKQLILTAHHHHYIFAGVRCINWLISTSNFQAKKKDHERVKSYLKQITLKGNGDEVVQERECFRLLKFVDQFLPWFAQNLPIHINAQFQFRSTFVRAYQQITTKRTITYQNFSEQDFSKFTENFRKTSPQKKYLLKQLCDFITLQQKSLIDQHKYKSQLLSQLIKSADSHCIRAIISEMCTLMEDTSKLFTCLKMLQYLISYGEIQFVEMVKLYVVPTLLGYLLPVDFVNGRVLNLPLMSCSLSEEKCIIDIICICAKITQKIGLSTAFYTEALKAIQTRKGNLLKVQDKHISQFLIKVIDMQTVNTDKRPHISNKTIQNQLISILQMRQNRVNEGAKISNQWRKSSAINQLNQFKESKADFREHSVSNSFAGLLKNWNTGNVAFVNSVESFKTPEKMTFPMQRNSSGSQQLISFRDVINNSKPRQSNSGEFQLTNNNRINPINEESSFMAFNESHMSKFSEYSVKKSKEDQIKQAAANQNGTLKHEMSKASFANRQSSSQQSKGDSVVYFERSQDYHSEMSAQPSSVKSQKLQKSQSKQQKQKSNNNSQKSLKMMKVVSPEQSTSTLRFDTSHISKSSNMSSSIQNFGKEDLEFPPSVPKPNFGFKRREEQLDNNVIYAGSEKILGSDIVEKRPSLSKIIEENYKKERPLEGESESSEIKDLTGGRHRLNESIRFSEGSQLVPKELINEQNYAWRVTGNSTSPVQQYFPSKTNKLTSTRNQQTSPKNFAITYPNSANIHQNPPNQPSQYNQQQPNQGSLYSQPNYNPSQFTQGNQFIQTNNQYNQTSSQQYNLYNTQQIPQKRGEMKMSLSENKLSSNFQSPSPGKQETGSNQNQKSSTSNFNLNSLIPQVPKASFSNIGGKKRQIVVDQFTNDRLLELERELGVAMSQKNVKEQELRKKQAQIKLLKSKSIPNMGRKVQTLKKEDEILKILLDQKTNEEYIAKMGEYIKPIKNTNRISDYFLENQSKGTFSPKFQSYSRIFTKQILGSRCLLASNDNMELGYNYSQIQNQVSFYLTFHKIFDIIQISVVENSVILQKPIDLMLQNQPAGYQVKIKRKLKQIKNPKKQATFSQIINQTTFSAYRFPELSIRIVGQTGQENNIKLVVPCSIFNLVKPVDISSQIINQLRGKKVLTTEQLPLNLEFSKNWKEKVEKYFPKAMALAQGWFLVGFGFPLHIIDSPDNEFIKFKISQGKEIKFQIFNDPKSLLTETIISLLTSPPRQQK